MTHTPQKRVLPSKSQKQDRVLMTHKEKMLINGNMTTAYGSHKTDLTKRAVYKTSDVDLSEDLVQSTFLKTLLYLQKGGKIDTMRAFLNHILNDLIIDEYRKRKTVSLDVLLEQGFNPSVDYTERLINILDGKKMIALIDQLPKKYQLVIKLRYVQGLSLKEIGKITKQNPNTVSVQSFRGLKQLAALESHN